MSQIYQTYDTRHNRFFPRPFEGRDEDSDSDVESNASSWAENRAPSPWNQRGTSASPFEGRSVATPPPPDSPSISRAVSREDGSHGLLRGYRQPDQIGGWPTDATSVANSHNYHYLAPEGVQSGCGQSPLVQRVYKFFVYAPKYLCVAIGWTLGFAHGGFVGAGAGAALGAVVGSTVSVAIELFFGKYLGVDSTLQDQDVRTILENRYEEAAIFTAGCFVAGLSCHFLVSHFLSAVGSSLPGLSFVAQTLSNVVTYTGTTTLVRGVCIYSQDKEARKQWKKNLWTDVGAASLLSVSKLF